MRKTILGVWALCLLPFVGIAATAVAEGIDGVFSPFPVGAQTCVAVEIPADPSRLLRGLRWYNNDSTVAFARIVILQGAPGGPPQLDVGGTTFLEVTGAASAWSEAYFDAPVSSASGALYAIFVLPASATRTGVGAGTGPGIGYRRLGGGPPSYLSADGTEWSRLYPGVSVAVEPLLDAGPSGAVLLSSRQGGITRVGPAGEPSAETAYVTALLPCSPNPANPAVAIRFTLAASDGVSLTIYNLRGAVVRHLLTEMLPAGRHELRWVGEDERGRAVASGVYVVRLNVGGRVLSQRVTLVR
jgi:hypothetical protein